MAGSSATSSPKRNLLIQEEEQVDRLGALSDPPLLHILSFLPTLDAVRTSVLSARWSTLWTSIDVLDLDEAYNDDVFSGTGARTIIGRKRKRMNESKFVEFVGNVMSILQNQRTPPPLHKLRLNCCSQNFPLKDLVIRTAVYRGGLQTLDLRLPMGRPDAWLPSLLFSCGSLVDLRLDLGGSALILPGTLALVGLRRMRLRRVKFCDDRKTRALFSSSTALSSLALESCKYEKLGCLEIACSSLQELAIDSWNKPDGLGSCQVKIAAPQLSSFVYRASVAQAYVVEPLLCVDYMKIQFQHMEGMDRQSILDRATSLFSSLSSVRNLDMCPIFFEALQCRAKPGQYPFLFRNLIVLRTAVKHVDYGALGAILSLSCFIRHLRSLFVELSNLSVLPSLAEKKRVLNQLVNLFEGRGVVERVEIRCSDSSSLGSTTGAVITSTTEASETVLELVRILLGSQACLNKLILSTCFFCNTSSPNRRDAVMEKVLSFPRLSNGLLDIAFI